ncbi:MAG: hypothetical protein AUI47_11590 [Acidobacteria bacterium 13_1_40CM_2_68_5]|nr:MAG: hypothetical protein AUI47_11590 [Acidobacteria bacterium 13_1_40CM_2_68_5]OLE66758.1 MAG: hypothetical protein AUG09_05880 [Acidobacteria bacterium 13_1_20CM_2_68_7]
MSEFIFLYRGERNLKTMSPEEAQKSMTKWRAWFKDLSDSGHLKNLGQPLERAGKVVGGKHRTVSDGPYAETKDIIGGYSVIEARDLNQAAELAAGCPGIESGGLVEVRPVMPIAM